MTKRPPSAGPSPIDKSPQTGKRGRRSHPADRSESPLPPQNRSTRSRRNSGSPQTAAGRSPRAATKPAAARPDSESESEEDEEKLDESPPFYPNPHHVRFSPSVKTGSPFGRKTRSGRRGISSYLQSLPSEDEQSEFNRQYSRDLRKRQARKLSEEGAEEEEEGAARGRRGRNRRLVAENEFEEPVEKEQSGRGRRNRRVEQEESEEEKPRTGRRRRAVVAEEFVEEGEEEEEEGEAPRRSARRPSESQSEVETPQERPRYVLIMPINVADSVPFLLIRIRGSGL